MESLVYRPEGGKELVVASGGSVTIKPGGVLTVEGGITIPAGTPVNAVAAVGEFAISNPIAAGETVVTGPRTYEFTRTTATEGRVAIDVSTGTQVAATAVLTFSDSVTDGELVSVGDTVYEFDTDDSVGENCVKVDVSGEASANAAATALATAMATDPAVTVAAGTGKVTVTAKTAGGAGNAIPVTTTCTKAAWGANTLTGGSDATAAQAVTALAAAITGDESSVVTATAGSGKVTVAAKIKGKSGDSIAVSTTCANGSWGEGLAGGKDGTVASKGAVCVDASYLYVAKADNTVADTNWRRVSLDDAYY